MLKRDNETEYITHKRTPLNRTSRSNFAVFLSFLTVFVFLFGIMGADLMVKKTDVAWAEPDDDEPEIEQDNGSDNDAPKEITGKLSDFSSEYDAEENEGVNGFMNSVTEGKNAYKASGMNEGDRNNFSYILYRFFRLGYMNYTPTVNDHNYHCSVDAPGNGTALYHNCDVPTPLTDLVQTVLGLFLPSGPKNAKVRTSKAPFGLGVPSALPDSGVPANPLDRGEKYTALELYGYNLHYTSYKGEWDFIQVQTSARMKLGFGGWVKAGAKAIWNGLKAGAKAAAESLAETFDSPVDLLNPMNMIAGIGKALSGFFSSGKNAAINTLLDESDHNVFKTYGWYRVGFGETLYNARELSQEELAVMMNQIILKIMQQHEPDGGYDYPEDLLAIEAGPPKPKKKIDACYGKTDSDPSERVLIEFPEKDDAGGPTEAQCEAKVDGSNTYEDDTAEIVDGGKQQAETVEEWESNHSAIFSKGAEYGISCEMGELGDSYNSSVAAFEECWESAFKEAKRGAIISEYEDDIKEMMKMISSPSIITEQFIERPDININAPWSRFVCTEPDGSDMHSSDTFEDYVFLYVEGENGDEYVVNPACNPVRPPIQNGIFGNGYHVMEDGDNQKSPPPGIDTRRDALPGITLFMFLSTGGSGAGGFGLKIATMVTQVTNTVLDLAFAPIIDQLGLKDVIVEIIEEFRDSIYYPLIILVIAFAGLYIIYRAGRYREYKKGFIDLGIIMLTFMISVILLSEPARAISVVDEVPSQIERSILSLIFASGLDYNHALCSTDEVGTDGRDLNDDLISVDPSSGVRVMECEVWNIFAFTPYVEGQWGAGYKDLFANGYAPPGASALTNTNGSLVGNASVNMGGTTTVNNWALYQLDILSSGSITTAAPGPDEGSTPRNFYKIVDSQAGPNDGAGTDSQFFESWSGKSTGYRTKVGLTSSIVAIVGLITILVFAFFKIEITIITALMVMTLPFILLIGVHPSWGRMKLKKWVLTLTGLIIQRIALVVLLAVMLRVIVSVNVDSSGNYMMAALITLVVCFIFIIYRKPIMNMVTTAGDSAESAAQTKINEGIRKNTPKSVRNAASSVRANAVGVTSGAIGGYLAGGLGGVRKGVRDSRDFERRTAKNQQRRAGLGTISRTLDFGKAGKTAGEDAASPTTRRRKTVKERVEKTINLPKAEFDEDTQTLKVPVEAKARNTADPDYVKIDPTNRQNQKLINRLASVDEKLSKLEDQKTELDRFSPNLKKMDSSDVNERLAEIKKKKVEIDAKISSTKTERVGLEDSLHRENDYEGWREKHDELKRADSTHEAPATLLGSHKEEKINSKKATKTALEDARKYLLESKFDPKSQGKSDNSDENER